MSRAWPLGRAFVASIAVLAVAGLILMFRECAEDAAVWLQSFAIGTLPGAGLRRLVPQTLESQPPRRPVALNYLSPLIVIPEAAIAFIWPRMRGRFDVILPIAAGGFFYLALSDLVPAVHHGRGVVVALAQMLLILAGISAIARIGQF